MNSDIVWVRVPNDKLVTLRARLDDDDDESVVNRVLDDCLEGGDPLRDLIGICRGPGRRHVDGEDLEAGLGAELDSERCWRILSQLVGMGQSHDGASADDHDKYGLGVL